MLPLFKVFMDTDGALPLIEKTLRSGYVGQGPRVDELEKEMQKFLGCERPVLAVNSCTSALQLALYMAGAPGGYVITTPQTCTATSAAILAVGAKIIWADVDQFTGNIALQSVAHWLTVYGKHVKAVVCVDWSGTPCDYQQLKKLTSQCGIPLIEDAAHALLTTYDGKSNADTGGDYVCYSTQAIKHLSTGDGGFIVVPKGMEKRAKLLRWYGLDRETSASFRCAQTIQESGFKYHMNDITAAIGLANLPHIRRNVEYGKTVAAYYSDNIKPGKGVIYSPVFDERSSYWIYTILVNYRDQFVNWMKDYHNIEASPVHARNDKHPCYPSKQMYKEHREGIDYFAEHQVAIPCGHWVTPGDASKIVDAVNGWNDAVKNAENWR